MRFHHSTRRGRNRLAHHSSTYHHYQQALGSLGGGTRLPLSGSGSAAGRWAQLSYCRESNIHFNRRLPIAPPEEADESTARESSMRVPQPASAEQRQVEEKLASLRLVEQPRRVRQDESAESRADGKINMELARQKLIAQVEKHPFWSNKAAKRMQLTDVQVRKVYIYELTSYCERRELEWKFEPYRGGLVHATPFRCVTGSASTTAAATPTCASLADDRRRFTYSKMDADSNQQSASREGSSLLSTTNSSGFVEGNLARSPSRRSRPDDSATLCVRVDSECPAAERSTSASAPLTPTSGAARTPESAAVKFEPLSAIERRQLEPDSQEVWAIEIPLQVQPTPFTGYVYSTEIPNSSFVKRCHGCQGRGRLKCGSCHGVGYEVCISCSGKGATRNLSSSGSALSSSSMASGTRYADRGARDASTGRSGFGGDDNDDDAAGPFSSSSHGRGRNEPGGITSGSSSGAWVSESCHYCHGAGQKRCWVCAGKSYNHCFGCNGQGQLRCYLALNVTWLNHREESIINNTDNIIPNERLRLSAGLTLVNQVGERLRPLDRNQLGQLSLAKTHEASPRHAPRDGATEEQNHHRECSHNHGAADDAHQLERASRRLLQRHLSAYRQERLIRQRHRVTQIECHVVSYEWKQRRGHFVIYGDERKVYIAKYPFKSICSIT